LYGVVASLANHLIKMLQQKYFAKVTIFVTTILFLGLIGTIDAVFFHSLH
jgi:hypothetical protein